MEENKINKIRIISNILTGVVIVVISTLLIYSFYTISKEYVKTEDSKSEYMKRIEEALVRIYDNFAYEIDMETLTEGAIRGIANATEDPYTRYIKEEDYNDMLKSGTEKYGGLGIHINYDTEKNGIIVLGVMPNSPALEGGILTGDLIKQVGDTLVTSDNYYESVNNIKGPENTSVKLVIQRGDETITKEYTRRIVSVNNVESKVIEGNIGYIKILTFENNIALQFTEQFESLKAKGVTSIILDLRNNPGGLLDQTVLIARNILPAGEVVRLVYNENANKPDKVYSADGKNELKLPLVVLVNGNSASASEILAGAIKDYKKGTIVGEKTYGKGIVQTIEKLQDGSALAVTTSKYYTASGVEIHKNGIEPDVKISLAEEDKNKHYVSFEKDTQLKEAIRILQQK